MTADVWLAAVSADPARRDREAVLAPAVRAGMAGDEPTWPALTDPDHRRRAAYLLDLARTMRGRTEAEAAGLRAIRAALGDLDPCAFWPGERPRPPGTDPVAERWAYTRGCDLARLKVALRAAPPVLPTAAA